MDSMGSMTMAMLPTSTVSGVMSTSSSGMPGMPSMPGMPAVPGMEGMDMSCKISVSQARETRWKQALTLEQMLWNWDTIDACMKVNPWDGLGPLTN